MFDQIVKWVHNTAAIIHKGIKNSPDGTNPFVLDHHWHNPAESLPQRSRVFKREEPLQFPEEVPPRGQTHCIGRWVLTQGSKLMKWVSYPPCPEEDLFRLPHNMSTADLHWKGRQLPDGTRIRDGRHIEDLISRL